MIKNCIMFDKTFKSSQISNYMGLEKLIEDVIENKKAIPKDSLFYTIYAIEIEKDDVFYMIQNAIENEKKIDFGDCTFYVLKDKKGYPHFALYSESYVLTMVRERGYKFEEKYKPKERYKLIIKDPSEIKINPEEYRRVVGEMKIKNYKRALRLVGVENIEIPGKCGKIFDYLKSRYPIEISGRKFDLNLQKVKRVYDEIRMVKELKKRGLDSRSIAKEVYEKFIDKGLSCVDFSDYKFYNISAHIRGINFLRRNSEFEENIKKWKGKLDDREIAKEIYDEESWSSVRLALKFLGENSIAHQVEKLHKERRFKR